ncbi:MAG: twin-arginine translocation signal domain-containing protein [Comamonadaceae bacterium]|nr:MAG: twin-arginine translocation signal domain-containing protein [Comamonadaceae bacterium]
MQSITCRVARRHQETTLRQPSKHIAPTSAASSTRRTALKQAAALGAVAACFSAVRRVEDAADVGAMCFDGWRKVVSW